MSLRKRRDRGFSLITVFMLMVIMTGTAIGVLVASQSDLNLAGVGREQQLSIYAAEYAVAQAKALLGSQMVSPYNSTNGWNGYLTSPFPSVQASQCVTTPNAITPGTTPTTAATTLYYLADRFGTVSTNAAQAVTYNYCMHNNAEDPGYLSPTIPAAPDGNTNDARDPQHLLVIEAYGTAPNGAQTHLQVMFGAPTLNATGGTQSYSQEGAGATHSGDSGAAETGLNVSSGSVKF